MVNQFFTWESSSVLSPLIEAFDKVTLRCDLGPYKKGSILRGALLDYEKGELILQHDGPDYVRENRFKLGFTVEHVGIWEERKIAE